MSNQCHFSVNYYCRLSTYFYFGSRLYHIYCKNLFSIFICCHHSNSFKYLERFSLIAIKLSSDDVNNSD